MISVVERTHHMSEHQGITRKVGRAKLVLLAGLLVLLASPASAIILDLTTLGASGTIGQGFFTQVNNQSTGTGVIDPFLRIQANGSEQGVNSNGPYTMDEKQGTWTHAIHVSDFGQTDLGGVPSLRVLLDINQNGNSPLLSLDQFRIYSSSVGTYNTLAQLNANASLLYDMGAGNSIHLNYNLESGSGAGDMLAYLPYAMFAPHQSEYLYLFSEFGATGGDYASNDGFEEWTRVDANAPPPPPVPEPTALYLLGSGLIGAFVVMRRRSR
jgi:hypothetical protein